MPGPNLPPELSAAKYPPYRRLRANFDAKLSFLPPAARAEVLANLDATYDTASKDMHPGVVAIMQQILRGEYADQATRHEPNTHARAYMLMAQGRRHAEDASPPHEFKYLDSREAALRVESGEPPAIPLSLARAGACFAESIRMMHENVHGPGLLDAVQGEQEPVRKAALQRYVERLLHEIIPTKIKPDSPHVGSWPVTSLDGVVEEAVGEVRRLRGYAGQPRIEALDTVAPGVTFSTSLPHPVEAYAADKRGHQPPATQEVPAATVEPEALYLTPNRMPGETYLDGAFVETMARGAAAVEALASIHRSVTGTNVLWLSAEAVRAAGEEIMGAIQQDTGRAPKVGPILANIAVYTVRMVGKALGLEPPEGEGINLRYVEEVQAVIQSARPLPCESLEIRRFLAGVVKPFVAPSQVRLVLERFDAGIEEFARLHPGNVSDVENAYLHLARLLEVRDAKHQHAVTPQLMNRTVNVARRLINTRATEDAQAIERAVEYALHEMAGALAGTLAEGFRQVSGNLPESARHVPGNLPTGQHEQGGGNSAAEGSSFHPPADPTDPAVHQGREGPEGQG